MNQARTTSASAQCRSRRSMRSPACSVLERVDALQQDDVTAVNGPRAGFHVVGGGSTWTARSAAPAWAARTNAPSRSTSYESGNPLREREASAIQLGVGKEEAVRRDDKRGSTGVAEQPGEPLGGGGLPHADRPGDAGDQHLAVPPVEDHVGDLLVRVHDFHCVPWP